MDPESDIVIEAQGKRYVVFFGNRAIRMAERESGKPIVVLANSLASGTIWWDDVTTLLWAGLQQHHPDVSVEDVDLIIDEIGQRSVGDVIGRAISQAFPETGEGTAQGNGNRSQRRARAKAGTGERS